ncbi:hypothetical protein D770_05360 [Flammeovirgaceae bacterium 311]|nr:hypothetical protein D770_05360 [Flammeovirgaceae bacterium 311]
MRIRDFKSLFIEDHIDVDIKTSYVKVTGFKMLYSIRIPVTLLNIEQVEYSRKSMSLGMLLVCVKLGLRINITFQQEQQIILADTTLSEAEFIKEFERLKK